MLAAIRLANSTTLRAAGIVSQRCASTSVTAPEKNKLNSLQLMNFDPKNYSVPLRPITLDDTMEPYGSWKQAYEAEIRKGNRMIAIGLICFSASCFYFYSSGIIDGVMMPNLDNIMEETEPFNFDKEGRVTV